MKLDPKKVFQDTKQSVITLETSEPRKEKKKPKLSSEAPEVEQQQLPVPAVQIIQQASSEREILDSIALTKTKLGKKEEKQSRSAGRKGKRRKEKKEKSRAAAAAAAGRAGQSEKEFCEKCYEKKLRRKLEREREKEREREMLRAEEQQIVFDPEEPFVDRERYSQALLSLVERLHYCALIGRELGYASYAIKNRLKARNVPGRGLWVP